MGRAHLARRRIVSYESRIKTCEGYRKHFVNQLQVLKNKCLNREISYEEYENLASKKQGEKTFEEWIKYYDNYILECKNIIESERGIIKRSNIISSLASFFFISIFILLFATQGGKIIGFATQDNSQTYTEDINLNLGNSSSYAWQIKNLGQLTSLKISGKMLDSGSAKIYLDDILILDSNSLKAEKNKNSFLTGFAVQTGYNSEVTEDITNPTQTKEKEVDSPKEEVSPSPSDSTSAPNEILNEITFTDYCQDTCDLENLNLNKSIYTIRIELDNSEINIDSLNYQIIELDNIEQELNQTEDLLNNSEILNLTDTFNQTQTNETILNETISNITEISNSTLKLIKEIPTQRISINQTINLTLTDYFENSYFYEFIGNNLNSSITGDIISLTPLENFKGATKGKIIAYRENESLESNEFLVLISSNTVSISTTRSKITVGEPVKWEKNISFDDVENLTLSLPENAENIKVTETSKEENSQRVSNTITGNVISNFNSNKPSFFKNFFNKLRSAFTGYAISDSSEQVNPEVNIILDDNSKDYTIEYETEAPTSQEKETEAGKEILISGPDSLHYTDVIASTNIPNSIPISSSENIKLFWHNYENNSIQLKEVNNISETNLIENSEIPVSNIPYINLENNFTNLTNSIQNQNYILQEMPFDSYDLDGNGNLDYIEWVVPHLSNQTFTLIFSRENSSTPGNNISIEGLANSQYSHLSTDKTSSVHEISDNIIAYYPFDKDDATTSYDFANNYNGTFIANNITNSTNCVINNCFQLNGAGDYISVDLIPIDWTNRNWSASVWARLDADAAAGIGIFTNRPGNAEWVTLGYTSQNFIGVELGNGIGQIDTTINPAGTGWQYYTLVKNDSGLGLYINTTYYHLTNTPGSIGAPDTLISIGDWFNGGQTWKGAIDEFMFLNISLNDTQVSQIYQNTSRRYVSSGIQEIRAFNITSNVNNFNLSLQNYNRKFGTNISARIGTWDISYDYNTSDIDSSLNLLGAYFNFDNRSNLNENQTLAVDRRSLHNGTIIGGNTTITDSVYDRALQFDGSGDYVNVPASSDSRLNLMTQGTLMAWIKPSSLGAQREGIIERTTNSYAFGIDTAQAISCGKYGIDELLGGTVTAGVWQHVVCTINAGNVTIYLDGSVVASDTKATWDSSSTAVKIGTDGVSPGATAKDFQGSIDEVMIFNRSLTAGEVSEIYVKGRALWTFTDYQNITARNSNDNWSLNNFTIPTTATHVLPNFLLTSDSNRFFTPILQATTTNPANATTDYLITPDTTSPVITINFPANTTYSTIHLPLMFNVSLNEQGSAKYSLDNGLNNYTLLNSTGGTIGSMLNRSNGSIAAGSYTFKVYANDTAGNNNNTANVTFSIDLTSPIVTIINPQTAFYNSSSITFNVSLNENGSVRYSLDNGLTNYSMTGNASGTGFNATNTSIADGTYNFKVYSNDTAGNTNLTSNITFYVDTTKPAISFIGNTPADASSQSATAIVVNVSSNGSLSGLSDPDHYVVTNFDNSLVGWWTMDDLNASSDPIDLTGINNGSAKNGASQNSSQGSGRFGKSFVFDGGDDWVSVPAISLAPPQEFTFSFWIKRNELTSNNWKTLIGFGGGDGIFITQTTNKLYFESSSPTTYTDLTIDTTNWFHIVISQNSSNVSSAYLNGIKSSINPTRTSSFNVISINSPGRAVEYFNGSMDEIMIFNRSLSLAEIKSLYNASANKYYNNFTNLSTGSHSFTSYAVDSAANRNSRSRTVTISSGNTAPVITNVTISSSFSITENSFTSAKLNFTVYDADGFTDINGSNAKASFNRTLETTRKDPSCINTANWSTNYANFSCTVNIWYFDGSGDWTVNASIGDLSSANAVNQTGLFTLGQTSAFVTSPGNLTFGTLSRGASNQTASNDPLLLNNTGNKNITAGNVQINATDLIGETNAAYRIYAANISVGIFTGSNKECDIGINGNASSMNKSYFNAVNQSILLVGNHSTNDGSTGQEQLYFCIRTIGTENIGQAYSTNTTQGPWTIKILAVAFAFGSLSRKKKKITKDKLLKALLITKTEITIKESVPQSEVINILFEEIQKKYSITKQELLQIINENINDTIPVSIFTKGLGGLEAVCKYLKENKGLSYVEIARLLNRDQRTIWTAYNKASKKISYSLEINENTPLLPLSFIGNRDHTIIESSIIYLKEKGLKYVEIAKLLNRDQRNIWTTYKKATENREEKEYIAPQ
ncbi:MAG: LamG-like jellyroll fold domain-containing protein [Nanoarchaeota archaeon]